MVRDGFSEEETLLLREIGKVLLKFVSHCFGDIASAVSLSSVICAHTDIHSYHSLIFWCFCLVSSIGLGPRECAELLSCLLFLDDS